MPSELACGALGSVAGTAADALNEVTTYLLLNRFFLSPAPARCWVIDNRKAGIANTQTASQKGQRTMNAPLKRSPAGMQEPAQLPTIVNEPQLNDKNKNGKISRLQKSKK